MAIFKINLKKIEENYIKLKELLPDAIIAYALKANYDKRILSILSSLGCYAEVCSLYEYNIAKKYFKHIIKNGFGVCNAWLVNLENVHDRPRVNNLIGARIRQDKSKLGIDPEEIKKYKWDCVSFHTRKNFKEMLNLAVSLADITDAEYIDVGGGFREEIDHERISLIKSIKKKVIVEPGRYLVANACEVISKVIAVKDDIIVIDCGMNFLNKFSNSKYIVVSEKPGPKKPYKVCGPIPTDIDNIGFHNLPKLEKGDKVIIKNAGAYTLSMASNWTHKIPKIIYKE